MDVKTQSFYSSFYSFSRENIEQNPQSILPFFKGMLKLDFDEFINCWEFFLTKNEKLLKKADFNKLFTYDILNIAYEKNMQKTVKSILSNPVISKSIYLQSHYAAKENAFDILENLLFTQKIAEADSLLKLLLKNTVIDTSFGENMVAIVDKLFMDILKRQGNVTKKVDLPKKLRTLLTEYIAKIKGPEKALLEQRIREIS